MMQPLKNQTKMTPSNYTNIYERHAPSILISLRRYLPSDEDAEDVLLETFLAALESTTFPGLDESSQLAWLHKVAHNKCADFHRRARNRPALPLEQSLHSTPLYADDAQAPEQIALRQEERDQLLEHLTRLPEQHQQVILLRFGEGMRCVDIARLLHLPEGTVRGWLSRSLNTLRQIYAQQRGNIL